MSKTDNDDALIAALQQEMSDMSKSAKEARKASKQKDKELRRDEGTASAEQAQQVECWEVSVAGC